MAKLTINAEPGPDTYEITGVFAAPRELVYRARVGPDLVREWWGLRSTTTTIEMLKTRKSGRWRFILRGSSGEEYAFSGVYHLANEPEQPIYTFEFEPMPGHVLLETLAFEAQPDGTTRAIDSGVLQAVENRDGMLTSGMESGAQESWDRLDVLLARLQQEPGVTGQSPEGATTAAEAATKTRSPSPACSLPPRGRFRTTRWRKPEPASSASSPCH